MALIKLKVVQNILHLINHHLALNKYKKCLYYSVEFCKICIVNSFKVWYNINNNIYTRKVLGGTNGKQTLRCQWLP